MADVFEAPADFNRRIIGIAPPDSPSLLPTFRVNAASEHIEEELKELYEARSVVDQADALLDIIFIASGRLFEMGIPPHVSQRLFDEVCRANGSRVRGDNAKRPRAVGFDAVKPEGWVGPDLEGVLRAHTSSSGHVEAMRPPVAYLEHRPRPKVILLGHARHGKDTVAEIMRDQFGFAFNSSSMFCAERVMMPYFAQHGVPYASAEECYEDRVNHRATWFDQIEAYNRADPSRLCREMFAAGNDIYVGMRSWMEFSHARQLADHVVWVDGFGRGLPKEPETSFNIPFDSLTMKVIHNSGTLQDLEGAVASLVNTIL